MRCTDVNVSRNLYLYGSRVYIYTHVIRIVLDIAYKNIIDHDLFFIFSLVFRLLYTLVVVFVISLALCIAAGVVGDAVLSLPVPISTLHESFYVCVCVEFFFPDFPSFISRFYFIAQTEHFINCQQNDENIGNFTKIPNQLKLNQLKFTLQLLV